MDTGVHVHTLKKNARLNVGNDNMQHTYTLQNREA